MISDTSTDVVEIESNIAVAPEDVRPMGMDETARAEIMESMTYLYTRRGLAVVREYPTNARDTNVEAGLADVPIRVTLPSTWDGTLVIADDGTGMDKAELLDHYAQYGASSKRRSNASVGRFGFGCKSAFTMGDHFTVVSIKNGWRVTALFSRSQSGGGEAKILAEGPTDAANGTTVRIPVPDSMTEEVASAAREFFAAWEPGTVLVDGVDPARLHGRGYTCGPVILLTKDESADIFGDKFNHGQYVLMGPVLYPAKLLGDQQFTGTLIFRADIGEVDLPPSREGVRDSARTNDFIDRTLTTWRNTVRSGIAAEIAAATNPYDVATARRRSEAIRAVTDPGNEIQFLFRGRLVPEVIDVFACRYGTTEYRSDAQRTMRIPETHSIGNGRRENTSTHFKLNHSRILIITGVPDDEDAALEARRMFLPLARQDGYATALFVHLGDENGLLDLGWLVNGDPNTTLYAVEEARELAKSARQAWRAVKPAVERKHKAMKYAIVEGGLIGRCRYSSMDEGDLGGSDGDILVTCVDRSERAALALVAAATEVGLPMQVINLVGGQTRTALQRRYPALLGPADAQEKVFTAGLSILPGPAVMGRAMGLRTRHETTWANLQAGIRQQVAVLASKITDPDLRAGFATPPVDPKHLAVLNALNTLDAASAGHPRMARWQASFARARRRAEGGPQRDVYPLLHSKIIGNATAAGSDRVIAQHLVTYLNAAYAAAQAGT